MRRFSPVLAASASFPAALLAALVLVSTAFADATFVKSGPPPSSTVDARLRVVTVVFSENLDPATSTLTVTGPDGSRADQGDAHLDPMANRVLLVSLKPGLQAGRYTVQWTSVSAEDGQARSGSFDFTIAPVVRTVPEPNAMVKWALADDAVRVVFGERLNPRGSSVVVVGPDGARADRGDTRIDPNDPSQETLRVTLGSNARAGRYQVTWTAVAASGGSTFSGSFGFTLMRDQRPGLGTDPSPEPTSLPVAPDPVGSLDDARAVLARFMDARIDRHDLVWMGLLADRFRAALPTHQGPIGQVSNPCWYRYEVVSFSLTTPSSVAATVRIFQHFWPGDIVAGPPASWLQNVRLAWTSAGWRVDDLGPMQDVRPEPGEPHGPHTSACNVGRRPGVWLADGGHLPASGGAPGDVLLVALAGGIALIAVGRILQRPARPPRRPEEG